MQSTMDEFNQKMAVLQALLERHQADGILLRRVSSFAWATCGAASYVNTAVAEGASSLLITHNDRFLLTNTIEAPRLEAEGGLQDQGWTYCVSPWRQPLMELQRRTAGLRLVSDAAFGDAKEIAGEVSRMRAVLTAQEGERFRQLGAQCAQAMDTAARAVRPGMTEYEIAALVGGETQRHGIQPVVNLIATDERIFRYRHPLPTDKKLEKYAMLVLSGRKYGLVCSISRLVHFGPVAQEVQRRVDAAAQVNAVYIAHSRPGVILKDVFQQGQAAYAAAGFPDEWQYHHQGGAVGYEPREYLGTPDALDEVVAGQAFAWNPTVAGAKMEDTILVGEQSNEILTVIPGWPVKAVAVPGLDIEVMCPMVLEAG